MPVVGDLAQEDVVEITEYDRGRIESLSDYHQELYDAMKIATTAEQFARARIGRELSLMAQRLGLNPEQYMWVPTTKTFVRKQAE